MLLDLPEEELWLSIALCLSPKDVLSFLSVHRNVNKLSTSTSFWNKLLVRDQDEESETTSSTAVAVDVRKMFLLQSYQSSLSSVRWIPLSREMQYSFPADAREGHNSCVLDGPDNSKSLVITGGFQSDIGVTVMELPRGLTSSTQPWGWNHIEPSYSAPPVFVYGASLTPLPSFLSHRMEKDRRMKLRPGWKKVDIAKAVRFGGFERGGYSGETNDVWILTIVDIENEDDTLQQCAIWDKIETNGPAPRARAYHSATLIHDRYLVIIGGMTHQGSVLEECMLDTHTWKWINIKLSCKGDPRGRHGHSVIWDKRRDRMVMFGGGTGTDLMRDGWDNNEVWELKMKSIAVPEHDMEHMWEWSIVYKNTEPSGADSDDSSDEEENDETNDAPDHLSSSESLCLGRCHNSMRISPDTILLMFGGGHPSTNGILGYNLAKDSFIKPTVRGPLPVPRLSGVASALDTEGYVIVHGGFNAGSGGDILDMNVLDLAPYLKRNFTALPVEEDPQSHEAVTDNDAQSSQSFLQMLLRAGMHSRSLNSSP
ncbi:hypothetical protein ACHAWF_008476 [Thalassiosira exigua]